MRTACHVNLHTKLNNADNINLKSNVGVLPFVYKGKGLIKYQNTVMAFTLAVIKPTNVRAFHSSSPEDKIMNIVGYMNELPNKKLCL
jgi:hypothetical protein